MADMKGLSGSIVALVTPFAEDGSVDFGALGRLVDFHLENGTDALLTLGTTGESSTMSHEEDDEVCKFVVDRVADACPLSRAAVEQYADHARKEPELPERRRWLAAYHAVLQQVERRGHLPSFHHGARCS